MFKLTIIIPYYKISFFKETLESVENQTCKDFSLFIGNDASPENPEILIKETLKTTEFTYKEYNENFGSQNLVKQWERCIQDCHSTDWFHILGDDDIICDNFVAEFYKNLPEIEQNKNNVIKFSQRWIDEDGNPLNTFTSYPKVIDRAEHLGFKLINGDRSSLSEHIFRKSQLEKIKFKDFPLAWAADDIAVFEFSEDKPIFFINTANVLVRVSKINISGRQDNIAKKRAAKIAFEKYLINNHYNNLTKESLLKIVDQHIYYNYHDNTPLGFSLFKVYLHLRLYKKILALPKTYLILNKIIK